MSKTIRSLTPAEYDAILTALPEQHRPMIDSAINTGLRWGRAGVGSRGGARSHA